MKITFGFIGTGNMGGALVRAAVKGMDPQNVYLSNRTPQKAQTLAQELGCNAVDVDAVAANTDYIFLGVKPQMMAGLFDRIRPILKERKDGFILVSMAAGLTIEDIRRMAGDTYPVIRIMPNTPVAIGKGVVMYAPSGNVTPEQTACFCEGMRFSGLLDPIPENLMDAGSAVAGCGPAFASMFLEALADGGVACGLPRAKAAEYAAQMLLGTAALALESGQHPGQMKDAVCSPGGSTIAGVRALENGAFRAAVINAVEAAHRRNQELGK